MRMLETRKAKWHTAHGHDGATLPHYTVHACVRVCACARARVCVCVCVCVYVCMCVRARRYNWLCCASLLCAAAAASCVVRVVLNPTVNEAQRMRKTGNTQQQDLKRFAAATVLYM